MTFQTYLFLRVLRVVLFVATAPLWFPICLLVVIALRLEIPVRRWHDGVRRDWEFRK